MNLLKAVLVLGLCYTLSYLAVSASEEQPFSRPMIMEAFNEAKRLVDDTYLYSRQKSLERVRRDGFISPSHVLRLLKQPCGTARGAVRAADYFEQTLRILSEKSHHAHKRSINATALLSHEDLNTIVRVTGCEAQTLPPSCRTTPDINKYRTITSVCNNIDNPLQGASNTPFARWLPAVYEDNISQPKGWNPNRRYNGFLLPLVRLVSNRIFSTLDTNVVNDNQFTYLLTFYGQFNDHDLTFTPMSPSIRSFSNGIDCDLSCFRSEPCFPILIPKDDPRRINGLECFPFFRSAPTCGSGTNAYIFGGVPNVREQINARTAYLDLSQVYGADDALARELRDLTNDNGLLRVSEKYLDNGREVLPFTKLNSNMCATRNSILNTTGLKEVLCFDAGDNRVVENIALTTLHTMYLREHNRVARALKLLNPHWSSEQLYQETRKILGAYPQIIGFRDYLPHIVGTNAIKNKLGEYPGYDPDVDSTIGSVFATAAFRFAHATLQPLIYRLNEKFQEHPKYPNVPLHKAFFTPWRVLYEGGIDPLVRGLITHPAKLNKQTTGILVDSVRQKVYNFAVKIAQDLGSLNLQRGRDHGLPGYNAWRKFCGLSTPKNVAELTAVLNNADLAQRLVNLYGSIDNIDLWVGGIAEPFVAGGRVGPVFSCIIANQFQKIRQGDRFWWENPGVFTPEQKASLSKVSLARIICDNTGIKKVPKNPFLVSSPATFVKCQDIPEIDLSPWLESSNESSSEDV